MADGKPGKWPKRRQTLGRPRAGGTQGSVLLLKGTERWKDWLAGLAAHLGLTAAMTTDRALTLLAKESGYPPPPQRCHAKSRKAAGGDRV